MAASRRVRPPAPKAGAEKPSPTPTPVPAEQVEPSVEVVAQQLDASASPAQQTEPAASIEPVAASAAPGEHASDVVELEHLRAGGQDARTELLERAHGALRDALDALDEVGRGGVFFVEAPTDVPIMAAAQAGFDALRKVLDDSERSIAEAIATVRYVGFERRGFELLGDVLLDGTLYGPSHEEKHAPLTEAQHAELKAVHAVADNWADGAPVEAA